MFDSPKLALFDVDGTLVDSQHAIVACMNRAFVDEGLPRPDAESVRRVVGLSLETAIERLSPSLGSEKHARIAAAYRSAFAASAGQVSQPLYPGALEALDALSADGILLGIASGKSRRGVDRVVKEHGLEDRFVTVQTPDVAPGKPNPGMVLQAAAAAGIEPADTVVIGDTQFDIAMARAAGASSVGVAWGYHPVELLRQAGATRLIDSFDQLPAVVVSLMSDE